MPSTQAMIIADPKELGGEVVILIGDKTFVVSGRLRDGLREAIIDGR